MPAFVVVFSVHAEDHRHIGIFGGRGDDDFFSACFEMLFRAVPVRESAGAFQNNVHLQISPGELFGVADGKSSDFPAVNHDCIGRRFYIRPERAVGGIIFEQMGDGFGVGKIVDGHEFHIAALETRPKHQTADTPESVDCNSYRHGHSLHFYGPETKQKTGPCQPISL